MKTVLLLILILIIGFAIYVRVAPTNADDWHQPVGPGPEKEDGMGRYTVRRPATPGDLERLDTIALNTERTERLAGSPAEGRVTWVTRSKLFGFPDYTTAEVEDGELRIFARLRFGKGDGGVNRTRVETWLAALDDRS